MSSRISAWRRLWLACIAAALDASSCGQSALYPFATLIAPAKYSFSDESTTTG